MRYHRLSVLRVPPFVRYLLSRDRQEEADVSAASELNWRRRPSDALPAGLELEWLGVSGFRMTYEGHTLLIDPYVTRISLGDLLRRRAVPPSPALIDRHLPRTDAILLGHCHFDHALDAPAIAARDRAKVFGSASAAALMRVHGLGALAVEVEPYRRYEVGPFRFHFVPSVHARLVLGLSVPFAGDITCEHVDQLAPSAYRCGQVWGLHVEVGGARFYHQGSADLLDDAIRDRGVDVLLAGISGRGFTPRFTSRLVQRLAPRLVVPHHYDDFFRPLDEGLKLSTNVNLAGWIDEVTRASREVEVRTLAPLEPVGEAAP